MDHFVLFLRLGFEHILEGYDHLLFLAGLIIVTRHWKTLLGVVSAFTVAHSTTLVLSALNILSINPMITETLIAASITYVGIENVVRKDQSGRWVVAGLFGLVHGAGFSGHLTGLLQTLLGAGNIWAPLIGFNIGIELGQMAVIAIVFPVLWVLKNRKLLDVLVPEFSRMIAATGFILVIWRVWDI